MYVRSSADRPAWKSITVPWWWPLSQRCLLTSNPFAMGHCDRSTGQTRRHMQTHNLAAADVKTPIKTWRSEGRLQKKRQRFSVSPDCFHRLGLDLLLEKTVKHQRICAVYETLVYEDLRFKNIRDVTVFINSNELKKQEHMWCKQEINCQSPRRLWENTYGSQSQDKCDPLIPILRSGPKMWISDFECIPEKFNLNWKVLHRT